MAESPHFQPLFPANIVLIAVQSHALVLFILIPDKGLPERQPAQPDPLRKPLLLLEILFRVLDRTTSHQMHLNESHHHSDQQIQPSFLHEHKPAHQIRYRHCEGSPRPLAKRGRASIEHRFRQQVEPYRSGPRIQTIAPSRQKILHSVQTHSNNLQIYAIAIVLEEGNRSARLNFLPKHQSTSELIVKAKVIKMQTASTMLGYTYPQVNRR